MSPLKYLLLVVATALVPACVEDAPDLGGQQAAIKVAKVTICHVPPGNPANAHTISVGASAVSAHLAHGDHVGACEPVCTPSPETCADGVDNDCDGQVDEDCVCLAGTTEACDTGQPGTCADGTRTCNQAGTGWSACVGAAPGVDVCGDGLDNDCDGAADDGCVCTAADQRECYDGPPGTSGVGVCGPGLETCDVDGRGWGACVGETLPAAESCGNGADDDCDGTADDGCCVPVAEVCGDGHDNDCDGAVDEQCLGGNAWSDGDLDGLQTPGEEPRESVTFLLRTAATGALVAVAVSDADGAYWFSGVPAGDYVVEVVLPFAWALTTKDAGDDALDSDFDSDLLKTDPFAYDGALRSDVDAGMISQT